MLGTSKDLEAWELELATSEAANLPAGGFVDDYPDPDLAVQLVAIELNLGTWMREGREELERLRKQQLTSTCSGDHTHTLAEALHAQYVLGCLAALNTLAEVLAHLTEDEPITGPHFKRDAASQEQVRQDAVRLVARINDKLLEQQQGVVRSSRQLS